MQTRSRTAAWANNKENRKDGAQLLIPLSEPQKSSESPAINSKKRKRNGLRNESSPQPKKSRNDKRNKSPKRIESNNRNLDAFLGLSKPKNPSNANAIEVTEKKK